MSDNTTRPMPKIIPVEQRSPEWYRLRSTMFTASETGEFVAEEKKLRLTIAQIQEIIGAEALPKKATAAEWQEALKRIAPETYEANLKWTEATVKARKKLIAKKLAEPFYSDPRFASLPGSAWLTELRDRQERQMENNPAVQRGIHLEPFARAEYERLTGCRVATVGMVVHDCGGFGCSPDGLVFENMLLPDVQGDIAHGVEIKCPIPETHQEYLLAGELPDEYRPQVHHSMAASGAQRWDFFSYCPGLPPLHVIVRRDEYTERFLAGLLSLVDEMEQTRNTLAAMWEGDVRVLAPAAGSASRENQKPN